MSGDNSGILLFSGLSLLALLYSKSRMRKKNIYLNEIIDYEGFCHCQSIKFKARAPRHLVVIRCNCSICDDSLTHYKFNTGVACHMFCKKCGVQPFYQPRSKPNGIRVTLSCVNPTQIQSYEIKDFDGQNWESAFENLKK